MFRRITKSHNYHWQFLRDFFSIGYLRYLVTWFAVVPILISIFGGLPPEIIVAIPPAVAGEPSQSFPIKFELPFKWWLLWFSSFLYVVALGLYGLRSPLFIRRYRNFSTYKSWDHSPRWLVWEWFYFLETTSGKPVNAALEKLQTKGFVELSAEQRLIALFHKKDEAADISGLKRPDPHIALGNRKIYYPIVGKERTHLFYEVDSKIFELQHGPSQNDNTKSEEMFWELYGAQSDSALFVRIVIWALLGCAGFAFLWAVAENILFVFEYLKLWDGAKVLKNLICG